MSWFPSPVTKDRTTHSRSASRASFGNDPPKVTPGSVVFTSPVALRMPSGALIFGSNFLSKAEIDTEVVRKAADVVVDSKDQARLEAGDFVKAIEGGLLRWADVRELGQVIVGRYAVRKRPEDVTLFKSVGIAIEDVALAARVYQAAVAAGVGRTVSW